MTYNDIPAGAEREEMKSVVSFKKEAGKIHIE